MDNAHWLSFPERASGTMHEPLRSVPAELPLIAGWDIAARNDVAHAGGDFVDVFDTPHGLAIMVGELFSDSVDAALCTHLFRILLRAVENRQPPAGRMWRRARQVAGPRSRVLTDSAALMNTSIGCIPGEARVFATLFFGLCDTATGLLRYINAGHEPPVIVNTLGVKRKLAVTGPALGLYPGHTFEFDDVLLQPGETLLAIAGCVAQAANRDADAAPSAAAFQRTMLAIRRTDYYLARPDTTWSHSCHV